MTVTDTAATPHSELGAPLRRSLRGVGDFFRELLSRPQSAVGTLLVLFFVALAVLGPWLAPYTENDQNHPVAAAPSAEYPFGTDHLGRDVFSRVILGARSILVKAGVGTLIAVLLGTFLGLAIGYAGGLLDDVASRVIDAFLALPALLVALVTLGIVRNLPLESGTFAAWLANNSVLLVIALVYVPIVARGARSPTLDETKPRTPRDEAPAPAKVAPTTEQPSTTPMVPSAPAAFPTPAPSAPPTSSAAPTSPAPTTAPAQAVPGAAPATPLVPAGPVLEKPPCWPISPPRRLRLPGYRLTRPITSPPASGAT